MLIYFTYYFLFYIYLSILLIIPYFIFILFVHCVYTEILAVASLQKMGTYLQRFFRRGGVIDNKYFTDENIKRDTKTEQNHQ